MYDYRKKTEKEAGLFTGEVPKDLPFKYQQMYDELLDLYEVEELESFREAYGDEVIQEIYEAEFGCPYANPATTAEGEEVE